MTIDKFGRSKDNQVNVSTGVSKTYVHENFIEANVEEDVDLKNTYKIKNSIDPVDDNDLVTKKYLENNTIIDDGTYVKNNEHTDFNGHSLINVNRVIINNDPVADNDAVTKSYVDKKKQIITIWAEESSSLQANTAEYSWGNGGTSSKDYGYPMMVNGRILRAGISINPTNTTATIEIMKNGRNSVGTCQKLLNQMTTITIFEIPIEMSQGDFITFKTQSTSGTTQQALVSLLIELDDI